MISSQTPWAAPVAPSPIFSTVTLPGSKSLTNRLLVLAALGETATWLHSPLRARDTDLMVAALQGLGVVIEDEGNDLLVVPAPMRGPADIDCGLAGNVMRFLPAVAGLADGRVRFDGDTRARDRPLAPLLDALRHLGVTVESGAHGLPFVLDGAGHVKGGQVKLDASLSSQFISALLLAGCRYDEGVAVTHIGPPLPSRPHIQMTVETLAAAGLDVRASGDSWQVLPGVPHIAAATVEPDLANAMPFFAAAIITGGEITISGWPQQSVQPVSRVTEILEAFGGRVAMSNAGLSVAASGRLVGVSVNMSDVGELVPSVAGLAAFADSPTTISGVAHLRGHETDRLHALTTEINSLGGDVEERDDGLLIRPRPLRGGRFHSHGDHRLATTGALIGLLVPGVAVVDVESTNKTLPAFTRLWANMLDNAAA